MTLSMGLTVVQLELPLMSIMTVNPISRTSSLKQKIKIFKKVYEKIPEIKLHE
jgi:hypothetical protein